VRQHRLNARSSTGRAQLLRLLGARLLAALGGSMFPGEGGRPTGRPGMASVARVSRVRSCRVLTAVTVHATTAPPLTAHAGRACAFTGCLTMRAPTRRHSSSAGGRIDRAGPKHSTARLSSHLSSHLTSHPSSRLAVCLLSSSPPLHLSTSPPLHLQAARGTDGHERRPRDG
jgi:hypothetical protein